MEGEGCCMPHIAQCASFRNVSCSQPPLSQHLMHVSATCSAKASTLPASPRRATTALFPGNYIEALQSPAPRPAELLLVHGWR